MQNDKCRIKVSAKPTILKHLRSKYLHFAFCILNFALFRDRDGQHDLAVSFLSLGDGWDAGQLDPLEGLVEIVEECTDVDFRALGAFVGQKILYVLFRPGHAEAQPGDHRNGGNLVVFRGQFQERPCVALR